MPKPDTTAHKREEPPEPSKNVSELCSQARLGAAIMGGWGDNVGVHPTVAYSCRGAAKLINALLDAIREFQKRGPQMEKPSSDTTAARIDAVRRHFHEWHGAAPDDIEIVTLLESIDMAAFRAEAGGG